jgi:hypothetical protein
LFVEALIHEVVHVNKRRSSVIECYIRNAFFPEAVKRFDIVVYILSQLELQAIGQGLHANMIIIGMLIMIYIFHFADGRPAGKKEKTKKEDQFGLASSGIKTHTA